MAVGLMQLTSAVSMGSHAARCSWPEQPKSRAVADKSIWTRALTKPELRLMSYRRA